MDGKHRSLVSFGITLLLLGVILMLPPTAQAIEVRVDGPTTATRAADPVFILEFTFNTNELVPIEQMEAILEGPNGGTVAFTVRGAIIGAQPAWVKSLAVRDTGLAGYGYGYQSGPFEGSGEGYGYGPDGFGQAGYGYQGPYDFNSASGNGYGYDSVSGTGVLTYDLTLEGSQLPLGNYRLTARILLAPGSSVSGDDYQSPAFLFRIAGGGGGGTPAEEEEDGTGSGTTIIVDGVPITPLPEGALEAYEFTVTGSAGTTIILRTGSDLLPEIHIVLDRDVVDLVITVIIWPADPVPPGTDDLPSGVNVTFFISIEFSEDDAVSSAEFHVTLPAGAVAAPGHGVLLHFGDGEWTIEDLLDLVDGNGTGATDDFSDFAVAFDMQDPTVFFSLPSQPVSEAFDVTAQVADNLEVQSVAFLVDGEQQVLDTAAPWTHTVDVESMEPGSTHTVRAVATDAAGRTQSFEDTFTVAGAESDTQPGDDDEERQTGGWLQWLIFAAIGAVIIGMAVAAIAIGRRRGG